MNKSTSKSHDSSTVKNRAIIWLAVSSERQAGDDKTSLQEQERLARLWCDKRDLQVVRILEIDGYSRRESDIITLSQGYREKGLEAYIDLRRMWLNDEFDVLVAYTHDRLGRSTTLHSFVLENLIRNGKVIDLTFDGIRIDETNYRSFTAIGGMISATPVDRLVKATKVAKDKLIEQGLPISGNIPLSHKLMRDSESGKAKKLVLDEQYTQLFEDFAMLFLEGVAYNNIGKELKQRFGHTRPNGKAHRSNMFYELLYTPTFWGHMARGYSYSSSNGNQRGAWIFDESVPIPDDVHIARDVIPAVYEGETANAIKAELYRRMDIGGSRKPKNTYRYAGLCVCGACGSSMSVYSKPTHGVQGLRCPRTYSSTIEGKCTQPYLTPKDYLQDQMQVFLEAVIEGVNPEIFHKNEQVDDSIPKLKKLIEKREKIETEMRTLITEMRQATDTAKQYIRDEIDKISKQIERINEQIQTLHRTIEEHTYMSAEETRTIEELKRLTLECFWKLPDREINQWLRRLMGKNKFVILDREIIDIREKPRKKRKSGRKQ